MHKEPNQRQPKLFETFNYNNVALQCVKSPDCYNCYFYRSNDDSTSCERPLDGKWDFSCGKSSRKDHTSVVFEFVHFLARIRGRPKETEPRREEEENKTINNEQLIINN